MHLDAYQRQAQESSWHERGSQRKGTIEEIAYNTIALSNETGEFADIVKKSMRGDYSLNDPAICEEAALELGDVLWYLARLADELGYSLSEIAARNLNKIRERKGMREEKEDAFKARFQAAE